MSWRVLGDWGTTRLRLFRVEQGRVTGRVEGPGALAREPDAVLRETLAPWLSEAGKPDVILLSGMAGSRTGLRETPYAECPAGARDWKERSSSFEFASIPLTIAAGLSCRHKDGRADVMRGEETQIFGACALYPDLRDGDHTILLPGTHSKWVSISAGRVVEFRTFISGELFALLNQSSLLAAKGDVNPDDDADGFHTGFDRAIAGGLLGALFEARAAQLRDGRSSAWARGFISGVIIGAEIVESAASRALPPIISVIGAPELAARYDMALEGLGVVSHCLDGDTCVLAGLELLHAGP